MYKWIRSWRHHVSIPYKIRDYRSIPFIFWSLNSIWLRKYRALLKKLERDSNCSDSIFEIRMKFRKFSFSEIISSFYRNEPVMASSSTPNSSQIIKIIYSNCSLRSVFSSYILVITLRWRRWPKQLDTHLRKVVVSKKKPNSKRVFCYRLRSHSSGHAWMKWQK